jgi:glutathione peroxidase
MMWLVAAAALAQQPANPISTLSLVKLDGTPMPTTELAGKTVMFVNVASKCGYTPQYEGLQKLYTEKKGEGFVIVGVPCNQFGAQEPGTKEEIATFCKLNYGVTFPLLEKQDVNGANRSPLYKWLVASQAGKGKDIAWNFEKFVVDETGAVVARFDSKVTPDAAELRTAIDTALAH